MLFTVIGRSSTLLQKGADLIAGTVSSLQQQFYYTFYCSSFGAADVLLGRINSCAPFKMYQVPFQQLAQVF